MMTFRISVLRAGHFDILNAFLSKRSVLYLE